jgi:hypothetical protein
VFLRNETRAKSGFVSYVSISLCFDFDPMPIGVDFDKSKPDYLLLFLYSAIYQKKLALNSHFENFDFGSGGANIRHLGLPH